MKDFFERLNTLGKPKRNDIIEKDFHLHRLLFKISRDNYLRENLLFKGGTCLIKAYTGYYRFSEDIDFTWKHENIWKNKSKTQTKELCSNLITEIINRFKVISDELGLMFVGDKRDPLEVHISSGGRMVLFFISYNSEIINLPSRIKVEINLVEKILFPNKSKALKSYIENIESDEIRFLYEELWEEYNTNIQLNCYDLKELFIEKCRAALTRKSYKFRDIIDIFYMQNKFGFSILEYKLDIKKKIKFMLDLYQRYRENIELIQLSPENMLEVEEKKLLLITPPKNLSKDISQIHSHLNEIRNEILNEH